MSIESAHYFPSTDPIVNELIAKYVSVGIFDITDGFTEYSTMGVYEDNKIVAGTVYHNYHEKEGVIELSSYSSTKKWLTKPVIKAMFGFPFDVLKCQLCVLRVSEKNKVMCSIARRFGFKETYLERMRGKNEGEYLFTMTDDMWYSHSIHNRKKDIG